MEHKATFTKPSEREIRIERVLSAPRAAVWKALVEHELLAQWWGRGNKVVVEKFEPQRGGHWRFIEHAPDGAHGFEGRFREVEAPVRIVRTFEWDGMPGHVAVETLSLEDVGDGRTRIVTVSLFHTTEERDGMVAAGREEGVNQSYRALDGVLAGLVP